MSLTFQPEKIKLILKTISKTGRKHEGVKIIVTVTFENGKTVDYRR